MRVRLTNDPTAVGQAFQPATAVGQAFQPANATGKRPVSSHQDCDCDCQCACPTDGAPIPVLSLPVAYYLELTPACNSRCPGCGNVYAAGRASLPPPLAGEAWRALIARLASHAGQFKLTGGEATLHPAFAQIVHAVEERGIPFTLFTNGRWPHPAALVHLLRDAATCEGLLVSLHGPDAATHEAFSGVPGSFDETAANVRRAVEAGLDVAISMVIHRHNWDHVEETLDLSLSLGANHVVCNRFVGAPGAEVAPSQAQVRAAVATVEALRAAGQPVRFGNCIPQCFAVSSSRGCTAGSTFATLDPWGRMRPCNHAPLVAGDLRTQSVEEVWQGQAMARWRSLVPAGCATCPALAACHGGCRAQALLAGQDQDPLVRGVLEETRRQGDKGTRRPDPVLPLYAGLRPVGRFTHRFEGGVGVLLCKSTVVPVPPGCDGVIPKLDGSMTLRQIGRQYGGAAVDWVGALHQEGMVTWVS